MDLKISSLVIPSHTKIESVVKAYKIDHNNTWFRLVVSYKHYIILSTSWDMKDNYLWNSMIKKEKENWMSMLWHWHVMFVHHHLPIYVWRTLWSNKMSYHILHLLYYFQKKWSSLGMASR